MDKRSNNLLLKRRSNRSFLYQSISTELNFIVLFNSILFLLNICKLKEIHGETGMILLDYFNSFFTYCGSSHPSYSLVK